MKRLAPLATAAALLATPLAAQLRPPNVVLIVADDLGWTDIGSFGTTFYETPNLDRLAAEGMRFTQAYAASPVCSPTRSSIMTGLYPARLNQTDWIPGRADRPDQRLLQVQDLNQLPLSRVTIAEALKPAGYVSASIGKWHLGGAGHLPTDQGFEVNVAGDDKGSPPGYFWPYKTADRQLTQLAETGKPGEHITERLGEEAAKFIGQNRDRPFFIYMPLFAVHTPLQARPELVEKYRAKAERLGLVQVDTFGLESGVRFRKIQNHAVYAGMVETMDLAVGRVMRALAENGLDRNTLVLFFSDNGGLATSEGWPTTNLPLRAGKGWMYEGGIREPMIARWPGTVRPGSTFDQPVISNDFMPTLRELAGLRSPFRTDGASLAPALRGDRLAERTLFWHYPHYSNQGGRPGGAVRDGDWKLIEFFETGRVELYNVAQDPGEQRDLAAAMPERTAELLGKLRAWRRSVGAKMPRRNPDYRAAAATAAR